MSHVIEYDKKNNPRDLWYDLPYLAKMEDELGNTTSSLKWFEGMAHAPPNSSPELKAFYLLTHLELLFKVKKDTHQLLGHLQEANSSLRRAGHTDAKRCPLSAIDRWHDLLTIRRPLPAHALPIRACGYTSDLFDCCDELL